MAQTSDVWISQPMRDAATLTRPAFAVPPLSCDSHMHVFGPPGEYPSVPQPKYTRPEGSLAQYRAMAATLGLARMVFVQASYYGADNRCILDAMASVGAQSRGVVILPPDAAASRLDDLHERGVRGLRLDLFKADRANMSLDDVRRMVTAAGKLAQPLGWHVEFYAPGRWIRDLLPTLGDLAATFVIDHMGYMTREEGLGDDDIRRFLDFARSDRCWIKLTGSYRVAPDDAQQRPDWIARELVASIPERLVWGTDWPHIPNGGRDTGAVVNRLAEWCPDERVRARILVENPARLYDFA